MPSFKGFKDRAQRATRKGQRTVGRTPTPAWLIGRYGSDSLGNFLIVVALVLFFLSLVPHLWFLSWVALVLMALCVARMFSKNTDARYRENVRFLRATAGIRKVGRGIPDKAAGKKKRRADKEHLYVTCDSCGQELRIPRGRGRLRVICPTCKHEFYKNT